MARRRYNDCQKLHNQLVYAGMKQKSIKDIIIVIKQHYWFVQKREDEAKRKEID